MLKKILIILIVLSAAGCCEQEDVYYNANRTKSMPEITVWHDDTEIYSGDEFNPGESAPDDRTLSVTFTIENFGNADLLLTNSPAVVLAGEDPGCFEVIQPSDTVISPGDELFFSITLIDYEIAGPSAEVVIINNDPDESSFSFIIVMDLSGSGQNSD